MISQEDDRCIRNNLNLIKNATFPAKAHFALFTICCNILTILTDEERETYRAIRRFTPNQVVRLIGALKELGYTVVGFPFEDGCTALVELRIRFWCPVCLREIKVTYKPTELQELQYLYYRHWKRNTRERCVVGRFMVGYEYPEVTVKIWEPYWDEDHPLS